jgi:hypothetical protein
MPALERAWIEPSNASKAGTCCEPFQWTNEIKRYKRKYET